MQSLAPSLIELCSGAGIEELLVFENRPFQVLDSGYMPELHHESAKPHGQPVLAMNVILRLNVMDDPAEVVSSRSLRRRSAAGKEDGCRNHKTPLTSFHGCSPYLFSACENGCCRAQNGPQTARSCPSAPRPQC